MLSFKGNACLFGFLASVLLVQAQPTAIRNGLWEFTFEPATGNWRTLRWNGTGRIARLPDGTVQVLPSNSVGQMIFPAPGFRLPKPGLACFLGGCH